MISPEYYGYRWSWYRPILNRGERPEARCRIDVRRLPIRMPGEEMGEQIPFAVHSEIEADLSTALRRLQDYAIRYIVKGEKVSAHQLPMMDAAAREMVGHLRKQYPHLPLRLLHHWCADEKGAPALLKVWEGLWEQSWRQDQADGAPWVPAVNVLLLRLMRQAIAGLPDEEPATTSHVMLCIVGGLYVWALQRFLKRYLEGVVEVTRIASYEAMMLPCTPMVFLREQPDDSLLGDDSHVIRAYGLDADLVLRMRKLREKVGAKNERGILALLAKDRLGDHLLKRTWARLSLWRLAEKTGHGGWMDYVLHAKKLDQLISGRIALQDGVLAGLQGVRDEPVAQWLLALAKGGRSAEAAGEPWRLDPITLDAFRVFEEDVRVEIARRRAERAWLDRKPALIGKARGADADRLLEQAYNAGELVWIQPDMSRALHGGKPLALQQACLRIAWSDYLAAMQRMRGAAASAFIEQRFLPGVLKTIEGLDKLFIDECSAGGCLLRGAVASLALAAAGLRRQLREWYLEASDEPDARMPVVSMCLSLAGEWSFARVDHVKLGGERAIAFSLAVAEAEAGVSRDDGVARLIAYRDRRAGLPPLGGVRIEAFDAGGRLMKLLYNNGIALTAPAVSELVAALAGKAEIRELRIGPKQAAAILDAYRLPPGDLRLIVIKLRAQDEPPMLLARVGEACLCGRDIEMFELLDGESAPARRILTEGLPYWGVA